MTNKVKKTGLFGGTFNPIHNGHIKTIQSVRQQFALDRVCFIPSAAPPHKPDTAALAPARDRLEMVEKSVAKIPGFCVSDIELKRQGPSYTIDTVLQITSTAALGQTFFLIIGSDAFMEIRTWKDYRQLLRLVDLIVMQRALHTVPEQEIDQFVMTELSSRYSLFSESPAVFTHPKNRSIFICNPPQIPISSTQIRQRVRQFKPFDHLVPEACEKIIIEKGLYL